MVFTALGVAVFWWWLAGLAGDVGLGVRLLAGLISLAHGALVGWIAWRKGRRPLLWVLYGSLLLIALIHVALIRPTDEAYHAARERRKRGKIECRHCFRLVDPGQEFCKCGDRVRPGGAGA